MERSNVTITHKGFKQSATLCLKQENNISNNNVGHQ